MCARAPRHVLRGCRRLDIKTPMLSDEDAEVTMAWVKDYAAPENGGLMYVEVEELRQEVSRRI